MNDAQFSAKRRAWEDSTLNDHLRDFDVSEERDRAIEGRAEDLLNREGHDGCWPYGERIAELFADTYTLGDVLASMLPYLEAGDYGAAGEAIANRLRAFAQSEALREASIQVDREHMEGPDDV